MRLTAPSSESSSLAQRIERLRLPLALGLMLLATVHHIFLRQSSVELRLASMLLVYGVVFPAAAWFLLGWLARVTARAELSDRERRQTASRLERSNRQIEALYTAGRLLAGTRSVDELLEPLADLGCRIALAPGGGLVWYAAEDKPRRAVTVGAAVETPESILRFEDLSAWSRGLERPIPEGVRWLPIHTGREVLGVLWLQDPVWDSATQQSLTTLINEIVATWWARRTEGRTLAALRSVGSSFRRRDARQSLQKFLDLVADALGAAGAGLFKPCEGRYQPQVASGSVQVPPPESNGAPGEETIRSERDGRIVYASAGENMVLALCFDTPKSLNAQEAQLLRVLGIQADLLLQVTESWIGLTWQERSRLARELHDGPSQSLAYIHLRTQHAVSALKNEQWEALTQTLSEVSAATLDTYEEVRRTIDDLRVMPRPGESAGGFLKRLARSYAEREGVMVRCAVPDGLQWPDEVGAQLTRFVQEALTNAVRHGRARRIDMALERKGTQVILSVSDDGIGFDTSLETAAGHHGIAVMRERIMALGGSLELSSESGIGTTLRAALPAWTTDFSAARAGSDR